MRTLVAFLILLQAAAEGPSRPYEVVPEDFLNLEGLGPGDDGVVEAKAGEEEGGEGEGEGAEAEGGEGTEGEAEGEAEGESEGEGEGEGEAEGEEEEEFTRTDIQVSSMLLGGVAFVIELFMLVNFPDDDIRRYAWGLVSAVTSIFVAVMIFSSINAWVLHFCDLQGLSPAVVCAVQYMHLTIWICALQLILAITSGSILEGPTHNLDDEKWCMADALRSDYGKTVEECGKFNKDVRRQDAKKSVIEIRHIEVPVEKKFPNLEMRQRRMKCWGTLFAHMSGFAAINAGGTMQHLEVFASKWYLSLAPLFINQIFIICLFTGFKKMRTAMNAEAIKDGRAGKRAAMFDEEVMDSENDISSLAGSYLLVASIRYALIGIQPNMLGEIEGETPWHSVYALYSAGLVLTCLGVILILIKSKMTSAVQSEEEAAEIEESPAIRALNIMSGMLGMGFAWSALYASRTVFEKEPFLDRHHIGMGTIAGRVLLALVLSVVSMVIIFGLDVVGDFFAARSPPGQNTGAPIIFQIVSAKSILVGFSWEHAFDGGVEAISSVTSSPMIAETCLAAAVFLVVVPAWRRHILTKSMVLNEYYRLQTANELKEDYTSLHAHE